MYNSSIDARRQQPAIVWNHTPGGPVNVVPSTPSATGPVIPGAGTTQPQLAYTGAPFGVQPDGSLFPIPPARAMSLSAPTPTPTDFASQYPDPSHYQQHPPPELKRRMTSPAQTIGPMANAATMAVDMQQANANPFPLSYPHQTTTLPYHSNWSPMGGGVPGGLPAYPMYQQDSMVSADFSGQPLQTTQSIGRKSSSGT
jgi:hypothetical protein